MSLPNPVQKKKNWRQRLCFRRIRQAATRHQLASVPEYCAERIPMPTNGELRLCGETIDDDNIRIIAPALLRNITSTTTVDSNTIKGIHLSRTSVTDEGALVLASTFTEQTCRLQKLIMVGNEFLGAAGRHAIVSALTLNTSILHCSFPLSQLGNVGAKIVAHSLSVNRTLTHLSLTNNLIANDGAAALGEALVQNKTLQVLDLSENVVGDEGIKLLSKGLFTNKTLSHLGLSDNRFGALGMEYLVSLLSDHNATLVRLDVDRSGQQLRKLELLNYHVALNRAGLAWIRTDPNSSLLPTVLAKVMNQPDLFYGLIRELPHLLVS